MMSSIILRRHPPQLLNDEQYNVKTASAATTRWHLPQLLNDEQYDIKTASAATAQ
jgi:hypothetical protein